MVNNIKFIFFLFFVINSVLFSYEGEQPISEELLREAGEFERELEEARKARNEYSLYVYEIIETLSDEMEKELGLHCNGTSGSMWKTIEEIGVQFACKRRVTVEEARALHLYVMNKLIQIVNAHEKIQPFLQEHPFSYKNVSISINYDGIKNWNFDGAVTYVSNVSNIDTASEENKNTIFYYAADPFTFKLVNLFQEHYDDAVKLSQAANLKFPFKHTDTQEEKVFDNVIRSFLTAATHYHLECWSIGEKKDKNEKIEEVGLQLKAFGKFSKEQARALGVKTVEVLLRYMNNNPDLRPYLTEYPFPASRLKMRIDFGNSRYCSYIDEGIESLVLKDNEITYYQDQYIEEDKGPDVWRDHEVVVLAKESYPEANDLIINPPQTASLYKRLCSYFSGSSKPSSK